MQVLNRQKIVLIGLVVAGVGAAWWPISYNEPITKGIDAYEYHGPLFGNHTQSQVISVDQPLESIGALVVPLRRSSIVSDIEVTFNDMATGQLLQTQTIAGASLKDDAFTYLHLDPPLQQYQPIQVTFSAPQASAATAVGIRFHPDDVYAGGGRAFDGQTAPGDLALALQQRWPAWQVLGKVMQHNPDQTKLMLQALIISVAFSALATQLGWAHRPTQRRRQIELTLLALLAVAATVSRLPALQLLGGVSGGDPYNYLFITDSISHGENPFATKRLPGYPLLLLPAYLTSLDDHLWMRLINVASAGAAIFLVALLARRLRLPWSVQFAAAALLAWQKDFYLVSLRPEPYTLYAFLLLASIVLFLAITERSTRDRWGWKPLLFGLVLGYAAMTRQEGFVLALLLGIAAVAHILYLTYRDRALGAKIRKQYLVAFAPALLLVLPFFISNAVTYGNPIYTPYFEGERLNIIDSPAAAVDSAGASWGIVGSIWKTDWDQLERVPLDHSLVAMGALVALLWWIYHTHRLPTQTTTESAVTLALCSAICITSLVLFSRGVSHFVGPYLLLSAGMLLAAPLTLISRAGWSGVLVVLVALSQILIATWFHPFPKHYQQDFALISLALTAMLISTTAAGTSGRIRLVRAATIGTWALLFTLTILPLYEPGRFHAMIDKYNAHAAFDSVLYRAIQNARELPGSYGLDEAYLAARLYLPQNSFYFNSSDATGTDEAAQQAWLDQHAINTVIITTSDPLLTAPPAWQLKAHFKSEGDDERLFESFVYTRP